MMKRNITINPNHMFSGALAFLSNMYPCTITIDVLGQPFTFTSAEAAFQAGKCLDLTETEPQPKNWDGVSVCAKTGIPIVWHGWSRF